MKDRMRELVDILNKWAYEYYVLDNPTVADSQYDALYDELVAIEKGQNRVLADSPTRRIGGEPIKEFVQHTHIRKLYSLDKCNSFDGLRAFDEKIKKAAGFSYRPAAASAFLRIGFRHPFQRAAVSALPSPTPPRQTRCCKRLLPP